MNIDRKNIELYEECCIGDLELGAHFINKTHQIYRVCRDGLFNEDLNEFIHDDEMDEYAYDYLGLHPDTIVQKIKFKLQEE